MPRTMCPALPPVSSVPALPAPLAVKPEDPGHVITVIRGIEKQTVRFKKAGATKVDDHAAATESVEGN